MTVPPTRFEVGKTYATRSYGDYECVFTFTVVRRTAQFVTLCINGEEVRRKVRVSPLDPSSERCDPFGVYSLSPVLVAATHLVVEEATS